MNVAIVPVKDHEEYKVNNHLVYINNYGNWTCKTDLHPVELTAFATYETLVIKNKAFKKHTKATYKP